MPSDALRLPTRALLTALAAVLVLPACTARRGDGSGLDPNLPFGGLDINDDGLVTDEDVDPGRTAVFTRLTLDGEDTEEATSSTAGAIRQGDGSWSLVVAVDGALPMELAVWFRSAEEDGWELVVGDGQLQGAIGDLEDYWMSHQDCPGDMVITDVGDGKASGWMDGTIEVSILESSTESQVGTLFVDAVSFNEVDVETWD